MTDEMMLNRYKNQVRLLEEQVTSLKIENAALKQRERDLQTAVQLNEGLLEESMKEGWPKFIRGSERNDR